MSAIATIVVYIHRAHVKIRARTLLDKIILIIRFCELPDDCSFSHLTCAFYKKSLVWHVLFPFG